MLGHVTYQVRRAGVDLNLKRTVKHDSPSRSPDLAKLNSNCHMKYSINFTEINFYPETSNRRQRRFASPALSYHIKS